jgi:hypothetical protein
VASEPPRAPRHSTRTCCRALYAVLLYVILAKPEGKCGKYRSQLSAPQGEDDVSSSTSTEQIFVH